MLLVIQPLTDYNLRTVLVLAVLGFLVWASRRHRHQWSSKRPWHRGLEKHCEKCDRQMAAQLRSGVRPAVGWNVRSLRRVPWRLISRHWGQIAATPMPSWLAAIVIWCYVKLFSCKLEEAENPDITAYPTLSSFFTRRLRAGARPVDPASALVSPSDGTVTHSGAFKGGFLQQVKGVHYSANYFLGLNSSGGEGAR